MDATRQLLSFLVLALALAAGSVSAQVTVYYDRAAFAAAAGPLRAVQTVAGPGSIVPSQAPYASLFDANFDGVCFERVFNYFNHLVYTFPGTTMRATLPPSTYAVGWTLSLFYPATGTFTITLSTGQTYQVSTPTPFFGVTSTSPIAWVSESFDNTYPIFLGRDYVAGEGFFLSASAGSVASCPPPTNNPPSANAGPDQSIHAGSQVVLTGADSFDDNTPTAQLGYQWSFVSKPAGSSATLSNASLSSASFTADVAGTYRVRLVVTDGGGLQSAPAEVTVSSLNQPPTANAGPDKLVAVGTTVALNGASSGDPDNDPLSYTWTVQSAPAGSVAQMIGAASATPYFQPDVVGTYIIRLTVSDPFGSSTPDTVEVVTITGSAFAEQMTLCADNIVRQLTSSQVTTTGNQTALGNFLNEATKAIQKGQPSTAIEKLNNAIDRTNGCEAQPSNPMPDGNGPGRDWVTDCAAQPPILACLRAARNALMP